MLTYLNFKCNVQIHRAPRDFLSSNDSPEIVLFPSKEPAQRISIKYEKKLEMNKLQNNFFVYEYLPILANSREGSRKIHICHCHFQRINRVSLCN